MTGRATYIQACRDSGVIPVSYFHRKLQQPEIDIKHHGLGPMGAKAIAIALVVSSCFLHGSAFSFFSYIIITLEVVRLYRGC